MIPPLREVGMIRKQDTSGKQGEAVEARSPDDQKPRPDPSQSLRDRLLKRIKRDDPNIYPLY